ncbi:MAG: 2Fe-2S iron-sulfur cluster-binding protein [Planctomycetota bacterium]
MSAQSSPEPVVTINGTAYPYEPGDTVIRVAHRHGIEVPHYCYHPAMSPAGNCRICMVEVVGSPRPQIACKMACTPGLAVRTDSDLAHEARADTMQMLLVNHPLDCPICDQAGECHLQDYSYQLGAGRAVTTTPKTKLPKNQPFGEQIVYDAERCIKCTLCVRFCEEITDTHELAMGQRGDHEQVIMTSAGEFTTRYSMNIVDLCPVGALTSRDFRFRSRLWFMDFVPSVCTGCARGCNVTVGARMGKVLRLEPRENQDVNRWWMCDVGRLDYKHANSPTRLGVPAVRDASGAWREATYEQAIQAASALLAEVRRDGRAGHVLVDGGATLEEMWVARELAAALGGEARYASHVADDADDFLIVNEKGANARGAAVLGLERVDDAANASAAVLVVERDTHVPATLREASGAVVAFVTDAAHVPDSVRVAFPFGSFAERDGWLVNVDGRVQRLRSTDEAGPPAVQPFPAVAQELLLDLDARYDVLDDAALEARLRATPGVADLSWPFAAREPAEVSS